MEDGVEDLLDLLGDEEQEQHHATIISDLISATLGSKSSSQEEELIDGNKLEESEKSPSEEDYSGAGRGFGFVDDLISHLATPEIVVAAPPNDEASMLIHSVVHE
ncbi:hypothetical protein F511_44819 [Dorcoceras hygrometricum]|uniref:Uncharacterized protein n=1 Tax=Dorcoceras hygrometricum TaxID=472368 RepID=A0A2Z7A4N5_9LAMI|nr:hypothetical protein F511_44819 [Dorcoceras hygrometricum]